MDITPIIHSHGPRDVRPLVLSAQDCVSPRSLLNALNKIGFGLDERDVRKMIDGMGLDSIQGLGATIGNLGAPVQFLQQWLPDLIKVVTAPRQIDTLVGVATAGTWESEEVVQGIWERTGGAQPYSDHGAVNLTSGNFNMERRSVVRFESGMEVGQLEEARSAAIRITIAAEKRTAATEALEIRRNSIGFYGYNSGANRTYGFLNDPNLPAYVTVAATGTGSSPLWEKKDFLQITADWRTILEGLRIQSKGLIDPKKTPITAALPVASFGYLTVTNSLGTASVLDWLSKNYPNLRIETAPELDGANGGANAGYVYAESFNVSGNGQTFMQIVPTKMKTLGVEKRIKSYAEAMSNATAGVFCRYPLAVYRFTGF